MTGVQGGSTRERSERAVRTSWLVRDPSQTGREGGNE
jgi:hypothetical protein